MLLGWAAVVVSATTVCAWPWSSNPATLQHESRDPVRADLDVLEDMFMALRDMQDVYFERWIGTWPEGIDWTRAVMGTHIAATLRALADEPGLDRVRAKKENVISGYFADLIGYYFAEDAFSIRNQAYDDMLWVVLGWLESIQLINEQSKRLSAQNRSERYLEPWYGHRWTPAFAHRARVFWELAAKGWDTKLCGGGMIWNPRLLPYKNAITNQLYIAASIAMFLHFPGDSNSSPFDSPDRRPNHNDADWPPNDPIFFRAAQDGHAWLTSSNMTNAQGLYADGFHISGYGTGSPNTKCDELDPMVYTYNQGVILSGLLGLFQATGDESYLEEGHTLIQNVIRATGYDLGRDTPIDHDDVSFEGRLPPWRGLGRAGILEDACDVWGTCSQDGQTFKGIWMHHFAVFCAPTALEQHTLHHPRHPRHRHPDDAGTGTDPDDDYDYGHDHGYGHDDNENNKEIEQIKARHAAQCARYTPWLRRNALAALGTRDERGLFGTWWTAGLLFPRGRRDVPAAELRALLAGDALPPDGGADDYRNRGVPRDAVWMFRHANDGGVVPEPEPEVSAAAAAAAAAGGPGQGQQVPGQKPMGLGLGSGGLGLRLPGQGQRQQQHEDIRFVGGGQKQRAAPVAGAGGKERDRRGTARHGQRGGVSVDGDPNSRGRGRTLETQGGGLAVLRALWVVSKHEA